jgi:hypothetical protein
MVEARKYCGLDRSPVKAADTIQPAFDIALIPLFLEDLEPILHSCRQSKRDRRHHLHR